VYEGARESGCRRASDATSMTETALAAVDIAGGQVERSSGARVTVGTASVSSARALTRHVTTGVHRPRHAAVARATVKQTQPNTGCSVIRIVTLEAQLSPRDRAMRRLS